MKKKRKNSLIIFTFIALLLTSCSREKVQQQQVNPTLSVQQDIYCLVEELDMPDWEAVVKEVVGDAKLTVQEPMVYKEGLLQWVIVWNDAMDSVTEAYIQLYSTETRGWSLIPTRCGFEKDGVTYSGISAVFVSMEGDLYCLVHKEDGSTNLATMDASGVKQILGDAGELREQLLQNKDSNMFMDLSGKIYLYQDPDISDINTNATHVEIYDENLQKKRTEVVPGRMYGILQASSDTEPYWYGMGEDGKSVIKQLGAEDALVTGIEGLAAREYVAGCSAEGYICLADAGALWVVTEAGSQKVLSWQEQGYYWDTLYGMAPGPAGATYLLGQLDEEKILISLCFTKEKPVTKKQEVVIALTTQNTALQDVVADFNRKSSKYCAKIMLPEGAENHTLSDDMFAKQTQFREKIQMELSAGRGPDILGDDVLVDAESLAVNGYLERLNRQEFQTGQQLEAVFESGMIGDTCYGIPYDFTLDFAAYRAQDVEGVTGWSMQDLMECVRQSEAKALEKELGGKEIVVNYVLSDETNTEYIDWENGVSHLTETPFLEVLAFAKEYAGDGVKAQLSEQEYFAVSYSKIPMYALMEMKNLYDKLEGDVKVLGYPHTQEMGIYVNARVFYVNSQSAQKKGAVEFLKYLLSEQAQTKYATHDFLKDVSNSGGFFTGTPAYFPVNKAAMETLIRQEQKKDKQNGYMANDGTFVYLIPPYTEEQLEGFRSMIENAKPKSRNISKIQGMVYEELEPYFRGSISAEEAAEKLDNRCQLFLDERGN
ncbi:MAG: extracellular solute-binding protein [Lachnospiraceae bacterium]|nr:extracellular solute-binding protein [Lachnospiraceae bacterium]